MQPNASPSTQTALVIALFAILYLGMLLRRTQRGGIDLYDFAMLSLVALLPAAAALFPAFPTLLKNATGVQLPFVAMFGALFGAIFMLVHRLIVRLNRIERQNCTLTQELSLLAFELERERVAAREARERMWAQTGIEPA